MTPPDHPEHDQALHDGGADGAADGLIEPDDSANDGGADRAADDDPGESEADGAA